MNEVEYKISEFLSDKRYKDILAKLVQTNTTNLPGNEMEAIQAILAFFPKQGLDYHIIDHGKNRGSLVITIPGKIRNRALAFVGHMDTVPVPDAGEWEHSPHDAVIDEDDMLHGRGAADMKGGVTAMIVTALYFLEKEIVPPKTLKFCFTADEESGGMGAISMREHGYLDDVEEMIVPEPTKEMIGICEKGALWLSIRVTGKSVHGSRPDLGINAVEQGILFTEKLKQSIDMSYEDPLLGKTTFSINQLKGGIKTNIIPNDALVTVDIRTTPNIDHEEVIHTAENIVENMEKNKPGLRFNIQVENNRPAVATEENHQLVKDMQHIFRELDYDQSVKGLQFYTDASQLIPQLNIPFLILGPGKEEMAHQRNESIHLPSIEKVAGIFITFVEGR
ncbi:M20 family peptidase [Lentibacillus lipolyticus]|nr:M20 family peptidase [Lentibacillus lipolyticus]